MLRRTALNRGRGKAVTAQERRHFDFVARKGCLVSGGPATLHHVTGYADRAGRFARSNRLIVPLAPEYHLIQFGPRTSVEALGHQGFFKAYGIDLFAEAERLWEEFLQQDRKAA